MRNYVDFVRASSNYLGRADETALSIHYDLTVGCWVYFDVESTDVATGIISKWYDIGIQKSYVIYKNAANEIVFSVSEDGTNEVSIDDGGDNYAESRWMYIVGRFTPSEQMALFVNGVWYVKTIGVPATIFNSSEAFEIGRYNRDNYLDGRVSQAFLCAYSVPDRFICAMFAHARALYMNLNTIKTICSSTSSTSSSTTSTSSSTTSSSTTSSSTSSSTTSSSSAPP